VYTINRENYREYLREKGYTLNIMSGSTVATDMTIKKYNYSNIYERFLDKLLHFIGEVLPSVKNDDIWDLRDMPIPFESKKSRPRYIINFEKIKHDDLKQLSKRFIRNRLTVKTYATCIDYLKGLQLFDKFLIAQHPDIKKVADVNRQVIVDYLGYMRTKVELASRTKVSRIGTLRTFFEVSALLGFDGIPKETLFYNDDYTSTVKILPSFYDEATIIAINTHLEKLPLLIARMFYVLQNVGMRISELCELKIDCLRIDYEGDYVLTYYQAKTRCNNSLPIKRDVADAILEAFNSSKEKYGEDTEYIFAKSKTEPISMDNFSYHMNRLIHKENIRDESGKLVRIKAHALRGTVATTYANAGLSANIIRMLLGQKTLGVLRHYVEIHEATVMSSVAEVLVAQNKRIEMMGEETVSHSEDIIIYELPNGQCVRNAQLGVCNTATACYECSCFKPNISHLDVYERQLIETKKIKQNAEIAGLTRIVEANARLEKSITSIIKRIHGELNET